MPQSRVKRTAIQSFETVAEKYSSSDVSIIFFKDIYSGHTEEPPATKKKDVVTKRLCTVSTHDSVTDGISRRITSG